MELSKDTRVRTVYGEWVTVLSVWDNQVSVRENAPRYIHISKLLLSTATGGNNAS